MCGEFADLESKHIEIMKTFIENCKNGAICNLPHGIIAEKREKDILFYKQSVKSIKQTPFVLGENVLPNGKCVIAQITTEDIIFGGRAYYVDYHKIPANAVWRTRRDGDVFQKLGSKGSKKLNDYYTDKKLSLLQRDNIWLLASENKVLIVLGQDISENLKIDSDTLDIVKLDFTNI